MVVNLETKKVRQITDGSTWYSTGGGILIIPGRPTENGSHWSSLVTAMIRILTLHW